MDTDSLIARLKSQPNLQAVADATGLRYMRLWKLANGKVKKPREKALDTLRKYFQSK